MIKDFKKELERLDPKKTGKPPSIDEMTDFMAMSFAQASSQQAFNLFRDKKYGDFLNISSLEQIERDRIFNELVLACLVILMLTLEAPDLQIEDAMKDVMLEVKEKIPFSYLQILRDLKIEEKYLRDWEKLIKMRCEEYSSDKLDVRSAAMEVESKESDLDIEKLNIIQLILPIHTVAIGCHHHICRGKTKGKDEAFKMLLRWLGKFYSGTRITLEGGKMTFGTKLKAKIKSLFG